MSKNYKVRPLGLDFRTSVTITDSEIIYKNGLFPTDTKRVPLADARVEYSSLIAGMGGQLVVKDHGSEVFSVGKIIGTRAFFDEFERKQNGTAPSQSTNTEFQNAQAPKADAYEEFDTYYYDGKEVGSRGQARGHFLKDIRSKIKDTAISKYYGNPLGSIYSGNFSRLRDSTVTLTHGDILYPGRAERNRHALLKLMEGTPNGTLTLDVEEYVLKFAPGQAHTIAYIPEAELYAWRKNKVDRKTGEFSYSDTYITNDLMDALEGPIQEARESHVTVKAVGYVALGAAALTAAFMTAQAAFGAELPEVKTPLDDASSEYSIQIEP